MTKVRITVSLDAELVAAANEAVATGRSESVSAWVAEALAAKADREAKLAGWRSLLAEYEAEHGAFTDEELEEGRRRDAEESERHLEAARRRLAER
jgi:Arc/MetJ-type ribon-helix-helix transcriptional regulator